MIGAWGIRLQGLRLKGLAHFSLDLDVDGLMVVEWVRGVCALVSGHSQMKIPVGVHGSEIYKVASQDAWQDRIRHKCRNSGPIRGYRSPCRVHIRVRVFWICTL